MSQRAQRCGTSVVLVAVWMLTGCSSTGTDRSGGAQSLVGGAESAADGDGSDGGFSALPTATGFDDDSMVILPATSTIAPTTTVRVPPATTTTQAPPPEPPPLKSLPSSSFDPNKAVLTEAAKEALAQFAAMYQRDYPGTPLLILGFTDTRDDDADNLDLSKRRAMAVSNFLAEKNILISLMTVKGCGERYAQNDFPGGVFDEAIGLQNRRVDIFEWTADVETRYGNCESVV